MERDAVVVQEWSERAGAAGSRPTGHTRTPRRQDSEGISISIYHDFSEASAEWRLYERDGLGYAFQTHDWLYAWHRHLAPRDRMRLCLVSIRHPSAGRLMFLPMAIVRDRGSRCLTWLGGRNADYHGPLLGEAWPRAGHDIDMRALWRRLRRMLPPFDWVRLEKQPEMIAGCPNPFLSLGATQGLDRAFSTELGEDWEAYYRDRRSGRSRSTDRRKLRKLGKEGKLRFRMEVRDEADAERVMASLAELKSRQLQAMGANDLFAVPGCREFYTDLARSDLQGLQSVLSAIELDGKVIAANWGVLWRGRLYWLLAAYDDAYGVHSPGTHLMYRTMEWCCENGVPVFDFSLGEEAYKLAWAEHTLRLYEHEHAVNLRGYPHVVLARLRRQLRRLLRKIPVLQDVKSSLRRTLLGRLLPDRTLTG